MIQDSKKFLSSLKIRRKKQLSLINVSCFEPFLLQYETFGSEPKPSLINIIHFSLLDSLTPGVCLVDDYDVPCERMNAIL
jgi:hypothetical protein